MRFKPNKPMCVAIGSNGHYNYEERINIILLVTNESTSPYRRPCYHKLLNLLCSYSKSSAENRERRVCMDFSPSFEL